VRIWSLEVVYEKKIAILGCTGMLGWAVGNFFKKNYQQDNIFLSLRKDKEQYRYHKNTFFLDADEVLEKNKIFLPKFDYIINCIGAIPQKNYDNEYYKKINNDFIEIVDKFCYLNEIKLINITTDYVYDGKKGGYHEDDIQNDETYYGKSKKNKLYSMQLRANIIGEELIGKKSLLEWVKSKNNDKIFGYINQYCNCITTLEYARICSVIIEKNLYKEDLFHVFSKDSYSKYELIEKIIDVYNLKIDLQPINSDYCNRTLSTKKNINKDLNIKEIKSLLIDQKNFFDQL
jgi:dTDP-4-dehydrorhamnose reductase